MSVAALSSAGFSQYISDSSNVSASQQAFQSLQQSLASGNLTAAQTAFNTYNQLNQPPTAASSSSSTGSSGSSQFSTDMTALGTAITSGNLATAQTAFATLQSGLKSTPAQAVINAESAVAQTVQWVDDLLNLSSPNTVQTAPVDPTTAILDSAYGVNTSASTDPTSTLLDSAYGTGNDGSTAATGAGTPSSVPASPSSGNAGSSASVNAYA